MLKKTKILSYPKKRVYVVELHTSNTYTKFQSNIFILTSALMGLWIFHDLMGGCWDPPCNSSPRCRSEKPKTAFKSSSEIIAKVIRSIFRYSQYRGHQRSSKVKFSEILFFSEMYHYLRKYSSWEPAKKKTFDSSGAVLSLRCHQIWDNVSGLAARGHKTPK